MPTVFRQDGIRFFFYSNEGNPREPLHVHAMRGNAEAKFWLYPVVHLAESVGFDRRTQSELLTLVSERRDEIERAWHEHFR